MNRSAARALLRPSRLPSCLRSPLNGSSRWYSSSPQKSRSRVTFSELALIGGTGYLLAPYAFTAKTSEGIEASLGGQVPRIEPIGVEEAIPVVSPVKVLSLGAAEKKLREQVHTFSFDGADGEKGRIDVIRVPSNNPVEDEWAMSVGRGVNDGTLFAGVYDGHAGWATSKVLKDTLIPYVSTALSKVLGPGSDDTIDLAIKNAFLNLDNRILQNAKRTVDESLPGAPAALAALAPVVAGSCALLTIYDPATSILRTAVAGDSRAVLGSWSAGQSTFTAEALSVDQNGRNEIEAKRLHEAHPGEGEDMIDPRSGRLFGMAITRAFGDHRWKYDLSFLEHLKENFFDTGPRPKYKTPPYMTAEPEITTRKVGNDDFVILASDGLWDLMSNDDAVECVSRWLKARRVGKPEEQEADYQETKLKRARYGSVKATPEHFATEDLDNAAVCLAKNALGGKRRNLFRGVMGELSPKSRWARDDITVQVIFFKDPYQER